MRNIITLADTMSTHTSSRSQAKGSDNYVSKLKVDYSNNNDSNAASTATSQQLDDLLYELSKEAGFKSTKKYNLTNKGADNRASDSNNTYMSNYNNSNHVSTFRSASTVPTNQYTPTLNNTGYYSDAEGVRIGTKKNVIDLELSPRKGSNPARIHEKVTTRQKYLKEEYVSPRQQQQHYNHQQQQHKQQSSHAFSSAIHKNVSSNQSGVSHKYHGSQGYGEVNIPPVPPPRKQVVSPTTQLSDSAFNSYRKGRFATTNTENFSPPLEVKEIKAASKDSEDEDGWERRKRDNRSADRFVSTSLYNNFRSGSLDIDLDDLVQRNLTNKAIKTEVQQQQHQHQHQHQEQDHMEVENEKGAYYISGIERPAVRTKNLPHTKYIFKIRSPEDEPEPEPIPNYSSHITIPEPAPIQEAEPIEEKETEVISLEPIGPGVQLLEVEGSRDGRASASRIVTRSLSTSNNLQETPGNSLSTNYAAYDSMYSKQQQQPATNEVMSQALENYASYKKSESVGGYPNYQQQQQQLQWMQQQQQPLPFFVAQPVCMPYNGPKEYKDTVKYTETHTNVNPNSLPPPQFPSPKMFAIGNNVSNLQHGNSFNRQVPITIETNHSFTRSDQTSRNQHNNNRNYVFNTPVNNNTISGYSFSETKQETQVDSPFLSTTTPSSHHYNVNNAGSPETVRSWTVSPGSSIKAKEEVKTEVNEGRESKISMEAAGQDSSLQRVKETAQIWHRPHITRNEAVGLLRNSPAGSFIVRNSQSYSGGYGLALKVSQLPPNVEAKGDDFEANFVRHFLIESTTKGVKLKGCSNEPVFSSLSVLIHQHTITPLSLPCKLLLPGSPYRNSQNSNNNTYSNYNNNNNNNNYQYSSNNNTTRSIHHSGSSSKFQECGEPNSQSGTVVYLESMKTDSMSDQEAFEKAIHGTFSSNGKTQNVTVIDMKISSQGVVLTDNKHKSFFRRHYPLDSISFCGVDPLEKPRTLQDGEGNQYSGRVFGFIAKNQGASANSSCHLFMEFDSDDFSALTYINLVNQLLG